MPMIGSSRCRTGDQASSAGLGCSSTRRPRPPSQAGPLQRLRRASEEMPHLVQTLTHYAMTSTIRAAATALFVHHSTLQDRLDHAERLLGWDIRQPAGRCRLQLALAERLLPR
ncbi:PucR-like helix-turn-helix protein [Pseudonocardia hierapolitana]|uniref:PucR-like helix-turn-helix protein n=2 Tax=Pseudonocardia hierapolitana TaxID=1128676 RepID=A0A561SK78_9PSEU|nr:PucR-like helix-turn-helix protein [Pseudonocardia hierapolitana]